MKGDPGIANMMTILVEEILLHHEKRRETVLKNSDMVPFYQNQDKIPFRYGNGAEKICDPAALIKRVLYLRHNGETTEHSARCRL